MAQAESTRVKPPRFLVDENLSVLLPNAAQAHNFEAIHVNHRGLHQARDWEILRIAIAEEWVLVTNNAIEFRGRYQKLDVHPGIVFLLPAVPRAQQLELFTAALDEIDKRPDMTNTALDVDYDRGHPRVRRYPLP